MNVDLMLPTFVITLREGVEAALVIGIVLAYLKKAGQNHLRSWVFGGVLAGLGASAIVGVLFNSLIQIASALNPQYAGVVEPLLEGIFSVIAIILLSWMLVWMTQHARTMRQEVETALGSALAKNNQAGWGIFALIFFAVLREGFETVVFIASKFQQGIFPTLGALAGLGGAAAIGVLLFRWGIKLNLRRFFSIMGVLLLLIVSGLVVTALAQFDAAAAAYAGTSRQSQSFCFFYERFAKPQNRSCVLGPIVWNTSRILPQEQFPGNLLNALFGYVDRLFVVQAVSYTIVLITVGGAYFQSLSGRIIFPLRRR